MTDPQADRDPRAFAESVAQAPHEVREAAASLAAQQIETVRGQPHLRTADGRLVGHPRAYQIELRDNGEVVAVDQLEETEETLGYVEEGA